MAADLKTRVIGDTTSYERAMDRAVSATAKYQDSLTSLEIELMKVERQLDDDMAASLRKQQDAADKLGKGMLVAGAAIAAGLGLAVNEAIKWESAWAGVTKVTEGTPEQMAALELELRKLATTLPASHEEIAAVAEAAGQLGVKRADVAAFTKTMIDMGVSTNLTAEEAATSMARFANIMGTPIDDVDRLGSAIVALGNDGASTEKEIVDMALRIAGAGRQAGLSEADVLALANALSSVGIEAEAGGSAISTVMINITKAVNEGGDAVEGFARVSGLSADEFIAHWKRDPAAALVGFEKGLAGVEAQGGDVFGILEELGITEIRQRDAVLRLSGAHDILASSLQTGAASWQENTALVDEANKRYETTESRLKVARNQLTELAITAGETLLPVLGAVAGAVTGMLDAFNDLPGPVKTAVTILGALAGVVALVGGAALVAGPKIAAMQAQLATLGGVSGAARVGLAATSSFLLGPWGIALGAGITALAIFGARHQDTARLVDSLVDSLDDETAALTDQTGAVLAAALEKEGLIEKANELGISTDDFVRASLGERDALEEVTGKLRAARDAKKDYAIGGEEVDQSQSKEARTARELLGAIEGNNEAVTKAVESKRRQVDAENAAADALGDTAEETLDATTFTKDYGTISADTAEDVKELEQKVRELRDGLALLNGETLGAEEAAIRFRDQIREMKEEVKENGRSLRENTAAGDANRQMLIDGIEAARDAAEAVFDKTVKTKGHEAAVRAADRVMRENIRTLYDEATQLGLNREQTRDYIAKILGIPKSAVTKYASPGLAASLARARELDAAADALDGRNVKTYYETHRTEFSRVVRGREIYQPAAGGLVGDYEPIIPMQRGGMVTGAGGPRDDMAGLFALSNREFVVNADATQANLPLLEAINAGRVRQGGRLYGGGGNGWQQGMGYGMNIENVNVRAFTDRFSLRQVEAELAMHGAA